MVCATTIAEVALFEKHFRKAQKWNYLEMSEMFLMSLGKNVGHAHCLEDSSSVSRVGLQAEVCGGTAAAGLRSSGGSEHGSEGDDEGGGENNGATATGGSPSDEERDAAEVQEPCTVVYPVVATLGPIQDEGKYWQTQTSR